MNIRTTGNSSLSILARVGPLFAIFIIFAQTFHRDLHYSDELINTSRTFFGLNPYTVLDYSVRPLFRLANLLFVALFGQNVQSLWIGSTFFALAIAYMLYVAGSRYAGLLGGFVGPFLLLASPQFRFSGLGAMPTMQSAVYAVAAMLIVLRPTEAGEPKPFAHDARTFLAFGLAALAVLAHPSQLPFVLGLAAAMIVVFGFNILRSGFRSNETARALRHGAIGAGSLLLLFAAIEVAYRYFGRGGRSPRLLPGQDWSYVGFWQGAIRGFGTSLFARHYELADFYLRLLIENYAVFTVFSLILLLLAVGWEINQIRTKKSINGIYEIPSITCATVIVVWQLVSALTALKTKYVLAAFGPIAVFADLVFIGTILKFSLLKHKNAIRIQISLAVLLAALCTYSFLKYTETSSPLAQLYWYTYKFAPGKFGFLPYAKADPTLSPHDTTAKSKKDNVSRRYCGYLANASGKVMANVKLVGTDDKTSNAAAGTLIEKSVKYVCRSVDSEGEGAAEIDLLRRSGFTQLLQPRGLGMEVWIRAPL